MKNISVHSSLKIIHSENEASGLQAQTNGQIL